MTEPLFTYRDKLDVVRFEINRRTRKLAQAEAKAKKFDPGMKAKWLALAALRAIEKDYEALVEYAGGKP